MRCRYWALIIFVMLVLALAFLLNNLSSNLRHVSSHAIEYSVDPSAHGIERELLVNATRQATAMWAEQNPGLSFIMTDKPSVLQITISKPWYANAVTYVAGGGARASGYAECPIWDTDTTCCVIHIHPYLLREDMDITPEYRANIVAHELGHVLGLSHYPDSRSNHLMGSPGMGLLLASEDTKGYVVPDPLPET